MIAGRLELLDADRAEVRRGPRGVSIAGFRMSPASPPVQHTSTSRDALGGVRAIVGAPLDASSSGWAWTCKDSGGQPSPPTIPARTPLSEPAQALRGSWRRPQSAAHRPRAISMQTRCRARGWCRGGSWPRSTWGTNQHLDRDAAHSAAAASTRRRWPRTTPTPANRPATRYTQAPVVFSWSTWPSGLSSLTRQQQDAGPGGADHDAATAPTRRRSRRGRKPGIVQTVDLRPTLPQQERARRLVRCARSPHSPSRPTDPACRCGETIRWAPIISQAQPTVVA